jgi:hypothetical protein
MRFDFEDSGQAVSRVKDVLKHLSGDPFQDFAYEAYVSSESENLLEVLTEVKCFVEVYTEEEDGLEEYFLFPLLPMPLNIRLRRTDGIVSRFQKYSMHLESDDIRYRIDENTYDRNPFDALRDLRQQKLELLLEEGTVEEGFETLIRGTGTETAFESKRLENKERLSSLDG